MKIAASILLWVSLIVGPLVILYSPACTKQEGQDIATAIDVASPVFRCVETQVLSGVEDPVAIGKACGGIVAATVAEIIGTLLAANQPSQDGGSPVASDPRFQRVYVRALSFSKASP